MSLVPSFTLLHKTTIYTSIYLYYKREQLSYENEDKIVTEKIQWLVSQRKYNLRLNKVGIHIFRQDEIKANSKNFD